MNPIAKHSCLRSPQFRNVDKRLNQVFRVFGGIADAISDSISFVKRSVLLQIPPAFKTDETVPLKY